MIFSPLKSSRNPRRVTKQVTNQWLCTLHVKINHQCVTVCDSNMKEFICPPEIKPKVACKLVTGLISVFFVLSEISSLVDEQLSEDQRSRIKVLIEQRRQEAATRHPRGPQENPSESRGAAALPREERGELRRQLEDSAMSGVEEEGSLPTGMQETNSEQTQTTQVNSLTEIQRGIEELTVTNEPGRSGQAEVAVKLKKLRDLNLDTCNKVAMYLSNSPSGTGGWSEIADKYGMKKINIRDIERTQGQSNPGKEVIEYLSAAFPALTVREFCCVLRNVRRRDIVELLECHIYENSEPANQRKQ